MSEHVFTVLRNQWLESDSPPKNAQELVDVSCTCGWSIEDCHESVLDQKQEQHLRESRWSEFAWRHGGEFTPCVSSGFDAHSALSAVERALRELNERLSQVESRCTCGAVEKAAE